MGESANLGLLKFLNIPSDGVFFPEIIFAIRSTGLSYMCLLTRMLASFV